MAYFLIGVKRVRTHKPQKAKYLIDNFPILPLYSYAPESIDFIEKQITLEPTWFHRDGLRFKFKSKYIKRF